MIADDGSAEETGRTIDRLRRETGLTIRHVWHEDRGFRKCAIMNRAIVEAAAEYLVFTDGDCIPRGDFLAHHARLARARPDAFGRRRAVAVGESAGGLRRTIFWRAVRQISPGLRSHGLPWSRKQLKLAVDPRLGTIADWITSTKPTWNGGNASTWKSNLLRVNGFDERMEYGGEDRELGERLINSGVRAMAIRYRAVCVHLDHSRGYVSQEAIRRNQEIRSETRATGSVWTEYGIVKRPRCRRIAGSVKAALRRQLIQAGSGHCRKRFQSGFQRFLAAEEFHFYLDRPQRNFAERGDVQLHQVFVGAEQGGCLVAIAAQRASSSISAGE